MSSKFGRNNSLNQRPFTSLGNIKNSQENLNNRDND